MEEIWKDVVGFEGTYMVSNIGRVKSVDRVISYKNGRRHSLKGRYMSLHKNSSTGYITITLRLNGKRFGKFVHTMVASAFIDNPFNKPEVNHINSIRDDNRVENLEWVTASENNYHAYSMGGRISSMKDIRRIDNHLSKKVVQLDICGEFIREFNSGADAADYVGVTRNAIYMVCRDERTSSSGYKWMYSSNYYDD